MKRSAPIPIGVLGTILQTTLRDLWRCLPIIILWMPPSLGVCSEQTIEIRGVVNAANYDSSTGEVVGYSQARSAFIATLSGTAWRICVTNSERNTMWSTRFYDGTNTYTLRHAGGSFWNTNQPRRDLQLAMVAPSAAAITLDADPFGCALGSITYGLSPQSFKTNQLGLVEMPLPWTVNRWNPNAFGFKWIIHAADNGRFLKNFSVLRDEALDLPEEKELLRLEFDYPETLIEYNAHMGELQRRKSSPNGYLRARYECTSWYRTNDLVIPKASKLEVYLPPAHGAFPARIFSLQATQFNIRHGIESLLPQIITTTSVADYRYKRSNATRIFKYAEYNLEPGDSWKSGNDPILLAQAEGWLKYGRKYKDFSDAAFRPGKNAPGFEVRTFDDRPLKLAQFKGKYLLLDFWATWCGPCVAETPFLKATWAAFEDDPRFAMVGLSLDRDVATARDYTMKNKMEWTQGFLGKSSSEVQARFSIHGIPAIFLIGPDGKLIDKDLRGEGIKSAVQNALEQAGPSE